MVSGNVIHLGSTWSCHVVEELDAHMKPKNLAVLVAMVDLHVLFLDGPATGMKFDL